MPMFIEIFLVLCIMAQPQFGAPVQPLHNNLTIQTERASGDHKSTIFSLINDAGNCTAYKCLKSEQNYPQLEGYCERPLPDSPSEDTYISYEVILCMALYDAVQHVCSIRQKEVTNCTQSFSGSFSCDTMIKGVPTAFSDRTQPWVTLFKARFGKISDCEGQCKQGKMISPICEYIWKANTVTHQAQVSSAASVDISAAENPQVKSQGHRKTNKQTTSKNKQSEAKDSNLPPTAHQNNSIVNNRSQNTEQVDHEMMLTHKSAFDKEANGNNSQSGSENVVKNKVNEQAQAENNTVHTDAKKLALGSNTQNDTNKQAHGTNSNLQNIIKKQEQSINSANPSAGVTPSNAPVSLSANAEHTPEADNYGDSTGNSLSSDSNSNTAPQLEHKSSADALDPDMEKQNDDNEDPSNPNDGNDDKMQDIDVAGSIASDAEDQEDRVNHHQEEKSDKITQLTETHQEETETDNTAQYNQLGDVAGSHFYAYFMTMVVICIIGYLVFHNKQKILALALEGRSRKGTRRRPNTSAYRKLDSNLEEAVTSTCSTSVTHVIY